MVEESDTSDTMNVMKRRFKARLDPSEIDQTDTTHCRNTQSIILFALDCDFNLATADHSTN